MMTFFAKALADDFIAQLSDSVPPDVKYISSGLAPIAAAISALAFLWLSASRNTVNA